MTISNEQRQEIKERHELRDALAQNAVANVLWRQIEVIFKPSNSLEPYRAVSNAAEHNKALTLLEEIWKADPKALFKMIDDYLITEEEKDGDR